jgi:hypothetical protein
MVAMRKWADALLAGDWSALAETIADDHRFEDRRLGMRSVLNKAGSIEQAQVIADLGKEMPFRVELEVVDTRSERLALVRQSYRSSDYLISFLAVAEVDDYGRNAVFTVFDDEDLDAALAEIEAMAAARKP